MRLLNYKAFSIMEVMLVVIIVGVIVAFAIPNFTKANNKAEERLMITNLRSIISAQEVYKSQNGDYWPAQTLAVPTANQGIAAINAALRLNIVGGTKYEYNCNSTAVHSYQCYAKYSPGAYVWQLYTNESVSRNTSIPNQVCCDISSPEACPTTIICK